LQKWRQIHSEREGPDCLAQLIYRGSDFAALSEHQRFFGGSVLLTGLGVSRWKAWPAVEKCLLKFSIIMDLSMVTVFPIFSAVGSWEEVFLFSMDFTVSFLEFGYRIQISVRKMQPLLS
jgi:hypothetical protein